MKNTELLIKEMKNLIYNINPNVKLLDNNLLSVEDFFSPLYEYRVNENIFPESKQLKEKIIFDVTNIYGVEAASKINKRLNKHFMAETSIHYSFPTSVDSFYGLDFDANLTWNALLMSVAMAKKYNQSTHLGIYVTDIPFSSANSPSKIEVTIDTITTIHSANYNKKCIEWFEFTDERIENSIENLNNINKKNLIKEIIKLNNNLNIFTEKQLNKKINYNCSIYKILNIIQEKIEFYDIYEKYTLLDSKIKMINSKIDKNKEKFFDKTIFLHKTLLDELINSKDINVEQITISNRTIIEFFIDQLKYKNSIWFKIFNNKELSEKFIKLLSGCRSGWNKIGTAYESPFHKITNTKNKTELSMFPFSVDSHRPEILIEKLSSNNITPTCSMLIAIYLMSGFLPVGGPLQSIFAGEVKYKLTDFLNAIGEYKRSKYIQEIPVEISLHTSAFDCKDNMSLYNYDDLKRMSKEIPDIIKKIPSMKIKLAHYNALPTLYNFYTNYVLDRSHPDFRRTIINQKKYVI